jgi:hypothetical protein
MNKQYLVLTAIFIFSFFNQSISQITISGKITDPNLIPVENALVEIFDQHDTLNIYSSTTDAAGNFLISNITDIETTINTLPNDYLIIRNYPNPFNPSTIIYFELPASENIEIKIFDILGREVRTLLNGFHKAGADQIYWDGKGNYNQTVAAGVYLCQIKMKDQFKVHKMVLLDGGTKNTASVSYNKITKQSMLKLPKVNSRFNYTVKVTGDSLDATYFRNLVCTRDTSLNLIVSKILEIKSIGTEGGVIGNDDFKVSIPAGAFDGSYNISLIKIADDEAFGENTVTSSFKLSGIPNNYSKPLKIIARYSGELSGESYMGVSKKAYDIIDRDSSIVYDLFSVTDSLEYLISYIPSKTLNNLTKLNSYSEEFDDLDKLIKFLTSYTHSNTEHFVIRYPVIYSEKIPLLAQVFEEAYTLVYDEFEMTQLFEDNPDVILESIDKAIYNEAEINVGDIIPKSLTFYVNKDNVYELQLNDIRVGAVQGLFLPDYAINVSTNWLSFAFYYWIEDLISDAPDYKYPKNFYLNAREPFSGFNESSSSDYEKNRERMQDHGIGMSVTIKYLKEFQNMQYSAIGNYFRTFNFMQLVEAPIIEWWPDFFKKYLTNELFKLPDDYFITIANAEWNINTEADTLKKFASAEIGKYQDLSAKMFKINFNYTDLDETQNLKFKMIGPDNSKDLSLLLFSTNNNKLEFIETTQSAEYEIKNIKSYIDNVASGFFAVLVNSNITQDDLLGESSIDLEVRVTPKQEPPALPFNKCKITLLNLIVHEHTEYSDSEPTDGSRNFGYSSGNDVFGQFEGNTFKGIANRTIGSTNYQDTIEITLNETLDSVKYLSWRTGHFYEDIINGIYTNEYFDLIAENIPIWGSLNDQYRYFQLDGLSVCQLFTYFYLRSTGTTPSRSSARWSTGHDCTETSRIQIEFQKK